MFVLTRVWKAFILIVAFSLAFSQGLAGKVSERKLGGLANSGGKDEGMAAFLNENRTSISRYSPKTSNQRIVP